MGILGKWTDKFGEAIYNGRPYTAKGFGKNFMLKGNNEIYILIPNLSIAGNSNVTCGGGDCGVYAFGGVKDTIKLIVWMDNNEPLDFNQENDSLMVNFIGYPYGSNYCIRVAKAIIE